jgi:hypothetical protein
MVRSKKNINTNLKSSPSIDFKMDATKKEMKEVKKYVKEMERGPYPDLKEKLDNELSDKGINVPETVKNDILTQYKKGPGNAPE